jgi:hypothetical protein
MHFALSSTQNAISLIRLPCWTAGLASDEMDGGEEVSYGLVVAGGDGTILLEPGGVRLN